MIIPFHFAAAYVLDILLGDPRSIPHPVQIIGWGVRRCEGFIRRHMSDLRRGGVLLWLVVVAGTYGGAYLLQASACWIHGVVGAVVVIAGAWTTLAMRSLFDQSRAVVVEVEKGDLPAARRELSMIVGRDTENLGGEEILQAVVETVAENISDGVIAPMCYLLLGGFPLALAYKAVNTLDSMVGYRDERYRDMGWCSARADDIVNWIPARLTGWLIVTSAFMLGLNGRNAWRIMRRDGRNHLSPNSGIPEAAMAGALGLKVGGAHSYFGKTVEKPTIGDRHKTVDTGDVRAAWHIMFFSSSAMAVLVLIALLVMHHV